MSAKDVAGSLSRNPVFAGVPAREIESLARLVTEEAHRHVKIVRHSRAGKDVVLELPGPGEVFGGVAVVEKRPYLAPAQATGPTVVLKIPAEAVIALSERHPLAQGRPADRRGRPARPRRSERSPRAGPGRDRLA